MGRELKRVPLNFNAPLNETWAGYINPYYKRSHKCEPCDGTGRSPETKHLYDQWYGYAHFEPSMNGSQPLTIDSPAVRVFAERNVNRDPTWYGSGEEAIRFEANRLITMWNKQWNHHLNEDDIKALVEGGRLWDFTRRARTEEDKKKPTFPNGWMKKDNGYIPTPQEVNDWNILTFGHDALNAHICVKAKAKRLGIKQLKCDFCKGDGSIWESPYYKRRCNSWKQIEPPRGRGFQLWQTTSEGSPISPVFRTLKDLAIWCQYNATTFGDHRATAAEWMKMLDDNYVYHQEGNAVFV
jgi:hypothetical protein